MAAENTRSEAPAATGSGPAVVGTPYDAGAGQRALQEEQKRDLGKDAVTLRTRYPLDEYDAGGDLPTVTAEGTRVSKPDAEKIQAAARRSDVTLRETKD